MSNTTNLSAWLNESLSEILSFPVPEDLTEYIVTIENNRDLDDYMKTLLDYNNSKHRAVVEEFKNRRYKERRCEANKESTNDTFIGGLKKNKKVNNSSSTVNNELVKETISDKKPNEEETFRGSSKTKKKNKFVNLYSDEGKAKDVILLKGRHFCECQASQHALINNCLKCGRIVCAQEGSGPCLYCGTLVCSIKEQNILNSDTKQSKKLYEKLMKSNQSDNLDKAIAQRNRLLEYDRTTAQRSKVIDDENDYFSSNSSWLTKEEREKLQKKEAEAHERKHARRSERKITLDFIGRCVIEEKVDPEVDEDFYKNAFDKIEESLHEGHVHPDFPMSIQPIFIYNNKDAQFPALEERCLKDKDLNYKVQDKELLLISDNGACLSMHQPWASLLVAGIKKHEGRSWYTSHRGRLWIAAASKQPTEESIKECEAFYKSITGNESLKFPTSYPTSCLLGCVSLVDCLPQEEYRIKYPDGESESPFVFVCEDFLELDIRFPISGSHKIYKLDSRIHQAARKALLRMAKQSKLQE